MRTFVGGLLGFAAWWVASVASAAPTVSQPPQQREAPSSGSERRWYGWQTLSVDGGAAALGIAALALELRAPPSNETVAQALLLGGGLAYVAGGPTIHLLHKQPLRALGSFGLRGGLTVVGGALGLALAPCPPPPGVEYGNCGARELILGAAAGTLIAMALDDSLLAWDRPAANAPAQGRFGLSPVIASDGRRELRVFGTF